MKRTVLIFSALFMVALAAPGFAGVWNDDFDGYASQTALENSDWSTAGGLAHGQLDDTNHFLVSRSMRIEKIPTETRPTRKLNDWDDETKTSGPSEGAVNLLIYDDGADIKAFDVAVENGANYVALGLRDDQVGVATEYTYSFSSPSNFANTGIQRSTGWHMFQFSISSVDGTKVRIDNQSWTGNVSPSLTAADDLTFYTNFGSPTDANQVWIDFIVWNYGAEYVDFQKTPVVEVDFSHFNSGTPGWQPIEGTDTEITPITDDGYLPILYQWGCMDLFDQFGGTRGVEFNSTISPGFIAPVDGRYKVQFQHQNGPDWLMAYNPWPMLTVSLNNKGGVNLGSDRSEGVMGVAFQEYWDNPYRSEEEGGPLYVGSAGETDGVWLKAGEDFTVQIQSISNPDTQLAFSRWDAFFLTLVEMGTEPPNPTPTPVSGVTEYEVYE